MNNACKLKHDYGKVCEKYDFVLPILEVWRSALDCNTFLDVLARSWNTFEALKRLLTRFSVFNICEKMQCCSMVLSAAFVSVCIRSCCVYVFE